MRNAQTSKLKMVVVLFSWSLVGTAAAGDDLHPDYQIEAEQFYVGSVAVPPGCLAQLATELNGDDTVAAVFLGRTESRGCLDANITYPSGRAEDVSYQITEHIGDDTFKVKLCQKVDGSMGKTCNFLVLKMTLRPYVTGKGSMSVLAIEKIGEW